MQENSFMQQEKNVNSHSPSFSLVSLGQTEEENTFRQE